jgi:rare lipoprotein A (peptidoglycan hydrolase)
VGATRFGPPKPFTVTQRFIIRNLAGRPTASGEVYDPKKMTAAVLPGTIPLGSIVIVTLDSDPTRSIEVYVNDHGLYRPVTNRDGSQAIKPLKGRVIDLSGAAFKALTGMKSGKVKVSVTVKSGPAE